MVDYTKERDAYNKKLNEQYEKLSDEERDDLDWKIIECDERIYLEKRGASTEGLSTEEVSDLCKYFRELSKIQLKKTGGICPEVGNPLDFLKDDLGKYFRKK